MDKTLTEATPALEPVPLSIRVLRRFNPLIGRLLRSRLHGLLSRDLVLLTYTGRVTGRRLALPLSYAESGERIYLCTRNSAWWRNLRGGAAVEVHLRGARLAARPTVLDPASAEGLDGFSRFISKNPRTGELLYAVGRGADGQPLAADLQREVLRSVVVRLDRSAAG